MWKEPVRGALPDPSFFSLSGIGVHTGECEAVGSDLAGIAVHVASRLESAAEPGEILVSETVRDLVAGSGLRFTDRGRHQLQGIEGERSLFALEE